jgi:pyruvate,water dikinase
MLKNWLTLPFSSVRKKDIARVGGKNSALGEMFNRLTGQGIIVPDGFCVTAQAYQYFLTKAKIKKPIFDLLKGLDARNTKELIIRGAKIRSLIVNADLPDDLTAKILLDYKKLSKKYRQENLSVAVRSSATAED